MPENAFDHDNEYLASVCDPANGYLSQPIAARSVRSLTTDAIVDALPTDHVKGKESRPLTGSTRNRYISTIKRMLHLCAEWGVD